MKKIFLLGVLFLISCLFLTKEVALAASCKEFAAKVDGSQVTLLLNDCDTDGKYVVHINDRSRPANNLVAATEISVFSGEATTTFHLASGDYQAILFFATQPVKTANFTIQVSEPLKCGDLCNPNDTRCPMECPSVFENGQWFCKLTQPTFAPPSAAGEVQPVECAGDGGKGIQTALGCIPTKNITQFVGWLLKFAIGIGGGIAFLLIIFGAIKVLTSSGRPEKIKEGQEIITSAIMGLLFIIFSLFLLQLIGVKILQIPGFGE